MSTWRVFGKRECISQISSDNGPVFLTRNGNKNMITESTSVCLTRGCNATGFMESLTRDSVQWLVMAFRQLGLFRKDGEVRRSWPHVLEVNRDLLEYSDGT